MLPPPRTRVLTSPHKLGINFMANQVSASTFVLVHGAWHGGWCWSRVAARLQAEGHTVHAPTLTGVGERSHLAGPSVNLSTHVADVVGEVEWKDLGDIVLCGHSYGGMVISGAAERLEGRIASIVYLDAFLPEDGQSLADIAGGVYEPGTMVTPITAEAFNVNEADRAWVNAKMTPQPSGTFTERLVLTGAAMRVPRKTYIQALVGPAPFFTAAYERAAADPSWTALQIDCGHDVMVDRPADLARMLVEAA